MGSLKSVAAYFFGSQLGALNCNGAQFLAAIECLLADLSDFGRNGDLCQRGAFVKCPVADGLYVCSNPNGF